MRRLADQKQPRQGPSRGSQVSNSFRGEQHRTHWFLREYVCVSDFGLSAVLVLVSLAPLVATSGFHLV